MREVVPAALWDKQVSLLMRDHPYDAVMVADVLGQGYAYLLTAMRLRGESLGLAPSTLVDIGVHTTLREHLEQRAIELGLRDRVQFEPFVPRSELWRRLPDYDAFVFTTSGLEAFGLVLIEAQAHGLRVAYSDLPGVKETLASAGVSYTPGDPRSLAMALDEMGRDSHRRTALYRAALNNARRYDIATTARQLRELTLCLTS
ncbi:glycosyltransferase [Streptomyces sp. NBC_01353]|uniref:glycosyltransferase n=1 Tax=Streptomyces sp. NBC_01353 TaxID=2903835 RepID=UPI002E318797|nr:glycosyltransferase [Streptomyces sp. NBC_01353]